MEEEQYAHIVKNLKYVESQEEEKDHNDEEEEALSLCDLPINDKSSILDDKSFNRILQPSSLPNSSELFNGFSSNSSSDMCPADEIIFCGKLIPFKEIKDNISDIKPMIRTDTILDLSQKAEKGIQQIKNLNVETNKPPTHRRRAESVSSVIRSNSVSTCGGGSHSLLMRNSRSLNYSRLKESSNYVISTAPEVDRNSSAKKATKPRWYSLVFRTMKVPPEMELNDIKNRQVRRNPSTSMFPTSDSGGKVDVNRSSGKVSWRILKALSCKDHSSVAVTTSFALPQASS